MPAAVRGTSAGKLKNGGRARIAVIETAPAIPMTAVATTMASEDVTKIIITRNAASIVGEDQKWPRAHLEAIGGEKQYRHRQKLRTVEPAERRAKQFWLAKRCQIVAEKRAGDEIGAVVARKGKAEQPDHRIFPIRPPAAAPRRLLIHVLGDLWAGQQKDRGDPQRRRCPQHHVQPPTPADRGEDKGDGEDRGEHRAHEHAAGIANGSERKAARQ